MEITAEFGERFRPYGSPGRAVNAVSEGSWVGPIGASCPAGRGWRQTLGKLNECDIDAYYLA